MAVLLGYIFKQDCKPDFFFKEREGDDTLNILYNPVRFLLKSLGKKTFLVLVTNNQHLATIVS